jgi:hypothetical protein
MDISNLIIYQSIFFGKRKVINRGRAKRHLMAPVSRPKFGNPEFWLDMECRAFSERSEENVGEERRGFDAPSTATVKQGIIRNEALMLSDFFICQKFRHRTLCK